MIESPVLQELKAEWTREAAREAALQTNRQAIVDILSHVSAPRPRRLQPRSRPLLMTRG